MRAVAIIQARTGSTRLPGKVLLPLAGKAVLEHVVRRVQAASGVDEVLVATTLLPADDVLVTRCDLLGIRCWRGSEQDVLDRYYGAAQFARADLVIRITSDCPLIDPGVIAGALADFRARCPAPDYLATSGFPRGLDVEIIRFGALAEAWRDDHDPAWREHVTAFLYRHPERFRLAEWRCREDLSEWRWTLDTPEDYELLRRIYDHFGQVDFDWEAVAALIRARPEWAELNREVLQKEVPGFGLG